MKCPTDGADLVMAERQGIEIDYCPKCRGVWLDRGELDKILERSATSAPEPQRQEAPPPRYAEPPRQYSDERRYDDRSGYGHSDHGYRKKKKKSFLDDIFDF